MPRINPLHMGILFIIIPSVVAAQPLLSPTSPGFAGESRSANYDALVDALYADGKATTVINGERLWVPWFSRSDSCEQVDLQSGKNCDSGTPIDATHNCMVTDEFSQVGILTAMGQDQARMERFTNTVAAIASTNGGIPAWRVYRDGDTIEQCRPGINGNCDTASDATARIIISLFTAAKNPAFSSAARSSYLDKAKTLSAAMLNYEVDQTCRPSRVGDGEICYWLAAGSDAKRGGIGSTDYAYTGYYADAIIAMLQAYAATGEQHYKDAAEDFGLNYLEAAKFNGRDFTVPPGRSYRWVAGPDGVLSPECTSSCSPTQWEDADAPRAFGICQANYYAKQMGIVLPGMQLYCDAWESRYGRTPSSIQTQYYPDGSAAVASQSGYFAQGLQAFLESGASHNGDFATILDNALSHYNPSTKSWDYGSCFGVYHAAFPVRALGMGIGRDLASFTSVIPPSSARSPSGSTATAPRQTTETAATSETTACFQSIEMLPVTCTGGAVTTDTMNGCRMLICTNGDSDMQVLACEKPDVGTKEYFEMYKQGQSGTAVTEICLGETCISDEGYVKSPPYPHCLPTIAESSASAPSTPETQEPSPTVKQSSKSTDEEPDVTTDSKMEQSESIDTLINPVDTVDSISDGAESVPDQQESPSLPESPSGGVNEMTPSDDTASAAPAEQNTTVPSALLPPAFVVEEPPQNPPLPLKKESPHNLPSPWVIIFALTVASISAYAFTSMKSRREPTSDLERKLVELRDYIGKNIERGYPASLLEMLLLRNGWSARYIDDAFSDLGIVRDWPDASFSPRNNPSTAIWARQPEPTRQ